MFMLGILFLILSMSCANEFGYLSQCPGVTKPVNITPRIIDDSIYAVLQIHEPADGRQAGYMHRRRYIYSRAAGAIGADPIVDFNKRRTMVFLDGYMDTAHSPTVRFLAGDFAAMGFNTIAIDAQKLYSFAFPVAARNGFEVSNLSAMLMRDLMQYGLKAKDIDLVGISLGGQTVSLVAKAFTKLTGEKVARIFAMDPGGPCFRSMSPKYRLSPTDAHFVQVIHTGIDSYGMATPMGHVDFYINGGEWQLIFNPYQPSEDLISHVSSAVYLYSSLLRFPDKFVGIKCENVQQAREHKCYENKYPYETNVLGFKADRNKPGIYYIPVTAYPPLYAPDDWMDTKPAYPLIYNDALSNVTNFVLSRRNLDFNLSPLLSTDENRKRSTKS